MSDRAPRYTSTKHRLHAATCNADIVASLRHLFSSLDVADHCLPVGTQTFTEVSNNTDAALKNQSNVATLRYVRNIDVMHRCLGFAVERRPSTLKHGGTGVVVTRGNVPVSAVTSLYPGMICFCCSTLLLSPQFAEQVIFCPDALMLTVGSSDV